jgi:hypothetical protein
MAWLQHLIGKDSIQILRQLEKQLVGGGFGFSSQSTRLKAARQRLSAATATKKT